MRLGLRPPPPVVRERSGEHRDEEHRDRHRERDERGHRRPGAQAREPPADAEERRADYEPRLDVFPSRQREPGREKRVRTLHHPAERGHGDEERPAHDEEERRIPSAGHVEKTDDLGGVHHLRDGKAEAEHHSGGKGRDELRVPDRLHESALPASCRTTYTVTIAVATKTIVATIERFDSRAMPQMP